MNLLELHESIIELLDEVPESSQMDVSFYDNSILTKFSIQAPEVKEVQNEGDDCFLVEPTGDINLNENEYIILI